VPRYLLTLPGRHIGVGSRLLRLADTIWLARRLDREVIVDWRDSLFVADPRRNYFTEMFEPVKTIGGVRIHYAPSRLRRPFIREVDALRGDYGALRASVVPSARYARAKGKVDVRTLDARALADYRACVREVYEAIRVRPEIARARDEWRDEHLRGRFVVGVNVSTGNGVFAPGAQWAGHVDVEVFGDEDTFLRLVQDACHAATAHLPDAVRETYKMFVATDSPEMSALLTQLPRVVTRRTIFPPAGAGRGFSAYADLGHTDREAAAEIVADMTLLARCDALVCTRSRFSLYARVLTDDFGGNVVRLEHLYRRLAATGS
jgi:Nodulation protein Z (NodZ)